MGRRGLFSAVLACATAIACSTEGDPSPLAATADAPERAATDAHLRRFEPVERGFRSHLRAHGWHADITPAGVAARMDAGHLSVDLRFLGWTLDGEQHEPAASAPQLGPCPDAAVVDLDARCLRRVEYDRGGIVEWWVPTERGLEQGWTLPRLPPGAEELVLSVGSSARPTLDATGDGVRLGKGFTYAGLYAHDALSRPLDTAIEVVDGVVQLRVDLEDAVAPIVVDPVLAAASFDGSGAAGDALGSAAGAVGDLNGDGFGDFVVGAPGASGGAGEAYVFLGSAAGLVGTPGTAHAVIVGAPGDALGAAVAGAGDLNGDGLSDLVIGAPGADSGDGRVYVYYGAGAGIASGLAAGTADTTLTLSGPGGELGAAVDSAGDVDGDGYADLILGAPGGSGRVDVVLGGPTVLPSGPIGGGWSYTGWPGSRVGAAVAGAGDVDGDGFSEVTLGGPGNGPGFAAIFGGGPAGLGAAPIWSASGSLSIDGYGTSVAGVGDVNGDGYSDVAIGAPGMGSTGRVELLLGGPNAPSVSAAWDGAAPFDEFGASVSAAGDVNGDLFADLVIGAPGADPVTGLDAGRAYVLLGRPGGPTVGSPGNVAARIYEGAAPGAALGAAVACAGDVQGDGLADLALGRPGATAGAGRVTVHLGSIAGLTATSTSDAHATMAGPASIFWADHFVDPVGDADGDGYDDLVFASWEATHYASFFPGSSTGIDLTAPAWTYPGLIYPFPRGLGDVDGDGYADLHLELPTGVGSQYSSSVFAGSPAGYTGATPAAASWQLVWPTSVKPRRFGDLDGDGYDDVASAPAPMVLPGGPGGPGASLLWQGSSVAAEPVPGGDVDGDGYVDFLADSPGGLGTVIFAGGPGGPVGTTPATADWVGPSGARVGFVGDVDGDGDADVGTFAASGPGLTHLHLGSASGPQLAAAWTGTGSSAFYGVSGPGDVDGDGHADILAGGDQPALYLGSAPAGMSTTNQWAISRSGAPLRFPHTRFAGDLNGDGLSDVVLSHSLPPGTYRQVDVFLSHGDEDIPNALPARARALRPGTVVPISPGLASHGFGAFDVAASARSPFGRGDVSLEVEAKPNGTLFSGTGTVLGTWTDSGVAGVDLTTAVAGLTNGTAYHWRARIRYDAALGDPVGWSRWYYGGRLGEANGTHLRTGLPGAVPSPPAVVVGSFSGLEGSPVALVVVSATDPDGVVVGWDWDCDGDGVFETPGAAPLGAASCTWPDDGAFVVVVQVTDDTGLIATAPAPVSIANVPPVITTTPPTVGQEGVVYTYAASSVDPGSDPPTWTLLAAPAGMTVGTATGLIAWTPTLAQLGPIPVVLQVDDGDGGIATQAWTVLVTATDTDGDGMPDAWETLHGLDPTDPSDAALDPDLDGLTNLDEWLGGTDPGVFDGPAAPVLLAPVGGLEAPGRPLLQWAAAVDLQGDPLTYDVEVTDLSGVSIVGAAGLPGGAAPPPWVPPAALPENADARWRARAHDPHVAGPWSGWESFFVNDLEEPPTVPVPLAPAGVDIATLRPTLVWTPSTDPDRDAVGYEVLVVDGTGTTVASAVAAMGSGPAWTVDVDLIENTRYRWAVQAVDEHGLPSGWSAPADFRVDLANDAPPPVVFTAPRRGEVGVDPAPDLVAEAVADPDDDPLVYVFDLDRADDFAGPDALRFEAGIPEVALSSTGTELEDGWWWARVRAVDGRGAEGPADVIRFQVGPLDPGPADDGPEGGGDHDDRYPDGDDDSAPLPDAACSCRAAPGAGSPIALLLLPWLRRRRTRG